MTNDELIGENNMMCYKDMTFCNGLYEIRGRTNNDSSVILWRLS